MYHHVYRCVLPPPPPYVPQRADAIQRQMQEAADEQQRAYEATIRKLRGQLQGLQAAVGAAAESGSLAALAGVKELWKYGRVWGDEGSAAGVAGGSGRAAESGSMAALTGMKEGSVDGVWMRGQLRSHFILQPCIPHFVCPASHLL